MSLQLPFAVMPLIHLVSDRRWMGQYAVEPVAFEVAAWVVAGVIAVLNLKLAGDELMGWLSGAGSHALARGARRSLPLAAGLVFLLGYVIVVPLLERRRGTPTPSFAGVHGPSTMPAVRPPQSARRIAAAVDFSSADSAVLSHAVTLARVAGRGATVVLLHVVESGGARMMGNELQDSEARADQERLELYRKELGELGRGGHLRSRL